MNLEYDDGKITCPNCGKREHPEVGMHFCSCRRLGNKSLDEDKWPTKQEAPEFDYTPRSFVYQAEDPDVTVSYSFIKRVSEKAVLLAIHDGNGLYEKWVPKSVVTGINENQIKIKSWFYKRNW